MRFCLEEKWTQYGSRLSEARASLSSIERQRSEAAEQLEHSQDDLSSSAAMLSQLEEDVADLGPKAAEARKALQGKRLAVSSNLSCPAAFFASVWLTKKHLPMPV